MVAATDLFDANSFFSLDQINAPDGGPVELSFSGRAGRVYQLWRSTELKTWEKIGSPTAPLTADGLVRITDSDPPPVRVFYRASDSLP